MEKGKALMSMKKSKNKPAPCSLHSGSSRRAWTFMKGINATKPEKKLKSEKQ